MNSTDLSLPELPELWQATLNWCPTAHQQTQFDQFYQLILAANRQHNLTRITEPTEFWEKHLWDSLSGVSAWLPSTEPLSVIDIGTGGGFPGIPVAIALPLASVTLLDSTRKKVLFLETACHTMSLTAQPITNRAETAGHLSQHRAQYNLALIRAVAAAPVCAEYALPFLQIGGTAVLYRGQWTEAETEGLATAAKRLGGAIASIESLTTPLTHSARTCVYLKKVAQTPDLYPRPVGVPTQRSL